MNKNKRVRDKNIFRKVLDDNKITLKQLKKIYPRTPPTTLEGLWYKRTFAPSVYYDVLSLYSKMHKKGWKI